MIARLLLHLTRNRPARIIRVAAKPYLIRYYMGRSARRTYYLHQFIRSDAERNVHNHPWRRSVAFVLAGGYFEERMRALCPRRGPLLETRRIGRFRRNVITEMDFHRIIAVAVGTWTLFAHDSRRDHGWGFFTVSDPDPDGYRRTLFHQPLRYAGGAWWERPGCLTGHGARAQVRAELSAERRDAALTYSQIPAAMGRAAKRTIDNLVYAVLTGNYPRRVARDMPQAAGTEGAAQAPRRGAPVNIGPCEWCGRVDHHLRRGECQICRRRRRHGLTSWIAAAIARSSRAKVAAYPSPERRRREGGA